MPDSKEALEVRAAISTAQEADAAWTALLPKTVNARYLPISQGEPGSPLRAAFEVWRVAIARHSDAWDAFHDVECSRTTA